MHLLILQEKLRQYFDNGLACRVCAIFWPPCDTEVPPHPPQAGATPRVYVYIYIETHRLGKFNGNHKCNCHVYMHKACAMCLIFVQQ